MSIKENIEKALAEIVRTEEIQVQELKSSAETILTFDPSDESARVTRGQCERELKFINKLYNFLKSI